MKAPTKQIAGPVNSVISITANSKIRSGKDCWFKDIYEAAIGSSVRRSDSSGSSSSITMPAGKQLARKEPALLLRQ
jgi:hypothetical protein